LRRAGFYVFVALALFCASSIQAQEDFDDFRAGTEALRQAAIELAKFYSESNKDNPLLSFALAPREIKVGGTFRLTKRIGRKGWFLAKPNEQAEITLTIEGIYNVVTGELQVKDLQNKLAGEEKSQ